MTNVKPTLPREVANAIESMRKEGRSNVSIIKTALTNGSGIGRAWVLAQFVLDEPNNADLLMSALINGYEVEQSPEDKLREYYDKCRENWMKQYDAKEYGQSEYLNGQAVGVSTTLHILGSQSTVSTHSLYTLCVAHTDALNCTEYNKS